MKDCKNTSGEDVSFTSRISQPLTNSSQALRTASSSSSGLYRSAHSKISQNSLEHGPFSLQNHQTCRSMKKGPNSLLKSDFRLKQVVLFVLMRLVHFRTAQRALVNFDLARLFSLSGWTEAVRLAGWPFAQQTSTTHPSSRFFLMFSRGMLRSADSSLSQQIGLARG